MAINDISIGPKIIKCRLCVFSESESFDLVVRCKGEYCYRVVSLPVLQIIGKNGLVDFFRPQFAIVSPSDRWATAGRLEGRVVGCLFADFRAGACPLRQKGCYEEPRVWELHAITKKFLYHMGPGSF